MPSAKKARAQSKRISENTKNVTYVTGCNYLNAERKYNTTTAVQSLSEGRRGAT